MSRDYWLGEKVEREAIAAWLDGKAIAARKHARVLRGRGEESRAEAIVGFAEVYQTIAAEVRAGIHTRSPGGAVGADRRSDSDRDPNPFRTMARALRAVGHAETVAVSSAPVLRFTNDDGSPVEWPRSNDEIDADRMHRHRHRAPALPEECSAFLFAMHDNTPGDNTRRVQSAAFAALERVICDVYGADGAKGEKP